MAGWMKKGAEQAPSQRETVEAIVDQCLPRGWDVTRLLERLFIMFSVHT